DKGFEVYPAADARSGLDLVQGMDIHLAVIDYHLGAMDGLQLLRRLQGTRRPITAFLTSSDEDPTLPVRALAEGARAFLSKTTPPTIFLRSLLQSLRAAESYFPLVIRQAIWLPVAATELDPLRN
ncbi:MAG TPA: response regulator, partial [Gemmataceae bacterium]|nr:response regulator [Gemmataceae bacterium]